MRINIIYENDVAKRFLFNDNISFLVLENTENNSLIIDGMMGLQKISFEHSLLYAGTMTIEEKQKDDFIDFVNFLITYAKDKDFQKITITPTSILSLYMSECKEALRALGFVFPRSRYANIEKKLTS